MRRKFLDRYALRPRPPKRTTTRPLTLEHLDDRIVLTVGMDAVYPGIPTDVSDVAQAAAMAAAVPTTEEAVYGPIADDPYADYSPDVDMSDPTSASLPTSYPIGPPTTAPPTGGYSPPGTIVIPEAPVPGTGGGLELGDPTEPTNTPPQITNFQVEAIDGYFQFTGTVVDDKDVAGLVVRFGGLLSGRTATVNEEGLFSFTTTFPLGTSGLVSVSTVDSDGLDSNTVFKWVQF